jgi:hypothetical protein
MKHLMEDGQRHDPARRPTDYNIRDARPVTAYQLIGVIFGSFASLRGREVVTVDRNYTQKGWRCDARAAARQLVGARLTSRASLTIAATASAFCVSACSRSTMARGVFAGNEKSLRRRRGESNL